MVLVPETDAGFTEQEAIELATMEREGWDMLRSKQFNPTASILRYTVTVEATPEIGKEATRELVSGLADLKVLQTNLSWREVSASRGVFELRDKRFIFYLTEPVLMTDHIAYGGKEYRVIEIEHWSEKTGRCQVITREIG